MLCGLDLISINMGHCLEYHSEMFVQDKNSSSSKVFCNTCITKIITDLSLTIMKCP